MPTVLELLGRDLPSQCDGHSLVPFLAGETPSEWRREACWECDFRDVVKGRPEAYLGIGLDDCTFSVTRGPRYKYVHFTALPPLFFDLEEDPAELHDLAADPAAQGLVLAHAQTMLSWRMAHDERTLTGMQLTAKGPVERPRRQRHRSRSGRAYGDMSG